MSVDSATFARRMGSNKIFSNVLLLLGAILIFHLSGERYISDSEIWAVTLAKKLGEDAWNWSLYYKAFFFAFLKPLYAVEMSNDAHLLAARWLFAAIGVASLVLFKRLTEILFGRGWVSIALLVFLLANSLFLDQAYRVRSDLLASLLSLGVTLAIVQFGRESSRPRFWLALIAALNFSAFLSTPKSVFLLFANLGLACVLLRRRSQPRLCGIWPLLAAFAVPIVIPLVASAALTLFGGVDRVAQAYSSAIRYFLDSSDANVTGLGYFSPAQFSYALGFITQNKTIAFLIFLGVARGFWMFICFAVKKAAKREEAAVGLMSFIVFVAVLVHTQKYPFFLHSMLPFLILPVGFLLQESCETLLALPRLRRLMERIDLWALGLAGFLIVALFVDLSSLSRSPVKFPEQMQAVRELESSFKLAGDPLYYDGIGILPRRTRIYSYPSPGDQSNAHVFDVLKASRPKVILYVTKLNLLEPELSFYLKHHYEEVQAGIWVADESVEEIFRQLRLSRPLAVLFSLDSQP